MPSILFMGLSWDDKEYPLPEDVDPEKIKAQLYRAGDTMEEAGYSVKLFVPQVKDGISLMKEELEKTKYDLVIIGGGVRTMRPLLPYFEDIINTLRIAAPDTKIAFNATIDLTLEAARRALPI